MKVELYVAAQSVIIYVDCSAGTFLSLFGTGCMEDKQKILDDIFFGDLV